VHAHIRALAIATVVALLPPVAHAASILDQEYIATSAIGSGIELRATGQSFTVGRDGFLDRVELDLLGQFPQRGPSNLTVEIREIVDGVIGDVLTSVTRSTADIPSDDFDFHFESFDFPDIEVDIGDVYLIRLVSDQENNEIFWHFDPGNNGDPAGAYDGGEAFFVDRPITAAVQDRGFRTFMTDEAPPVVVPEPSALALIGVAVVALAGPRRARR
jgi:hypothetical protein